MRAARCVPFLCDAAHITANGIRNTKHYGLCMFWGPRAALPGAAGVRILLRRAASRWNACANLAPARPPGTHRPRSPSLPHLGPVRPGSAAEKRSHFPGNDVSHFCENAPGTANGHENERSPRAKQTGH
jgi:hypothetical protein